MATQQPFFRARNRPYQLDHLFADATTEPKFTSWAIDPSPATGDKPASDHASIVADLDL